MNSKRENIKFEKKLLRITMREHKRCVKYPYLYPSFRRAKRLAWIILEMNKCGITNPDKEESMEIIDDGRMSVMFTCNDANYAFYKQKVSYDEYDIKFDESCHPLTFNRIMAKSLFFYIENFIMSTE